MRRTRIQRTHVCGNDPAKDVEQFDDRLRMFMNTANSFEDRFGKIRDEERTLAVKKLMPESLLNYGSGSGMLRRCILR